MVSTTFSRFLRRTVATTFCSGVGWLLYQIYQTKSALDNILRTDVIHSKQKSAEYIYIKDPQFHALYEEAQKATVNEELKKGRFWWTSSPSRWIKWWKKTLAWRLLSLAQTGNASDRHRALRVLSRLKHLKDSDYRQLAQACDSRTAVSLARLGADLRFFLEPPFGHIIPTKEELLERLSGLLEVLEKKKEHPCLQYFLSKAFPEIQSRYLPFDFDLTSSGIPTSFTQDQLLLLSLQSLLHHSSQGQNAKDLLNEGALPLLIDMYMHFKNSLDVQIMLCKIISHISAQDGVLEHLYVTGFIGLLAAWAQCHSIRLSVPAQQALTNLDVEEESPGKYVPQVYLLYPAQRRVAPTKVDVVFVHGLLGGIFYTWRQRDPSMCTHGVLDMIAFQDELLEEQTMTGQRSILPAISDMDTREFLQQMEEVENERWEELLRNYIMVMEDMPLNGNESASIPDFIIGKEDCLERNVNNLTSCWPKDWLPEDCSNIRILGIDYDTSLSSWSPVCPIDHKKRNLNDRSSELLEKLILAGIGSRPIVWVTHSMGGLLVKNMLVKARNSSDERLKRVLENTKAVVFYSTPHLGTPVAVLRQVTEYVLWPSIEVQELKYKCPALQVLHSDFLDMLKTHKIEIVSFAEKAPTLVSALKMQFQFVPVGSANPGVGEFFEIPQDHLAICKPCSRYSFLYQKVLHIIHKYVSED